MFYLSLILKIAVFTKLCCHIIILLAFHSVWMLSSLTSRPNLNIKEHMFISLTVSILQVTLFYCNSITTYFNQHNQDMVYMII